MTTINCKDCNTKLGERDEIGWIEIKCSSGVKKTWHISVPCAIVVCPNCSYINRLNIQYPWWGNNNYYTDIRKTA